MIRTCLGAFAARVFAAMVGGRAFLLALVFVFTAGTEAIAQTMTAPNITSEGPFLVDEGETAVATLTADDSDTATTDLIWTNTGGADSGKFSLTSAGVLTFIAAKDYEAPDDADADRTYEVTVQVSDGTETDSADLVVTLENVVELTAITETASVEFPENSWSRVATFTASSEEDRAGIDWVLAGTDSDHFSIDSPPGALRFALPAVAPRIFPEPPDFEAPVDGDAANTYELTLLARAGSSVTDTHTFTVTVTDVDEEGALSLSSTRPALGAVLTAVPTDPDGVTAGTAVWQWERSTGRNSWAVIDGAAAASYTPVAADTNTFLRVTATYADEHGTGKTVSEVAPNVVTGPLLTGLTAETDDSQADTARGLYPAFDPLTLHYGIGCNGTDTLVLTVSAAANARVGVAGVQAASAPEVVSVAVTADSDVAIRVTDASGAGTTYVVHCLSNVFFEIETVTYPGTDLLEDLILFNRSGYFTLMDRNGVPRLRRAYSGLGGFAIRFYRIGIDGAYRYGFGNTSSYIILDEDFEVVEDNVRTVAPLTVLNAHDFQILEDGNYLVMSWEPATPDFSDIDLPYLDGADVSSVDVLDSAFQIVTPGGQAVFTWNSWGNMAIEDCVHHRFPVTLSTDPDMRSPGGGYAHINGMHVVDGVLVASMRGCSKVLGIDVKPGVTRGDVLWRMGRTNLSDSEWAARDIGPRPLDFINDPEGEFCGQHTARFLPNGNVFLFDNGVLCAIDPWTFEELGREGYDFSRAVEYALDLDNHEAVFVRDHSLRGERSHIGYANGNVDVLDNGDWLVSWGRVLAADDRFPDNEMATLVDPATGQEKLGLRFRELPSDARQRRITATVAPAEALAPQPVPLTAEFPASDHTSLVHTGSGDAPQVIVAFNQPVVDFSASSPSISVQGATIESVLSHIVAGEPANAYVVTLTPTGVGPITFGLVADPPCASGGICTAGGTLLSEVPASHVIRADTTPPTVSNIEVSSDPGTDRTYAAGDEIRVTVTFSETVFVTGMPQLRLELGGGDRTADYEGGSGTAALVFTYTVADGESDTDGMGIEVDSLSGGTIRDEARNNAELNHDGLAADAGHKVDGVRPRLAASGGAVVDGTTLTLTYDEALDGGSRPVSGDFTVSECDAIDLGDRRSVWSGVMNPIALATTPPATGYNANIGGTLSDTQLAFDNETRTIERFEVLNVSAVLILAFDQALTDRGNETLRLHLCGKALDISDATTNIDGVISWPGAGPDWSSEPNVQAELSIPGSHPPRFASDSVDRDLAENSPSGAAVGDPLTAVDWDDDTLSYTLSGTYAAAFEIDPGTGQITTAPNAKFNFENTTALDVTVTATDPGGDSDTVEVIITVTNVPEPPTGLPTMVGIAQENRALYADLYYIEDPDGIDRNSFSYEWVRVEGNTDIPITGETSSKYVVTAADVGFMLKVITSFTDNGGTVERLTSAESDTVVAAMPSECPTPDLGGRTEVWSATLTPANINTTLGTIGYDAQHDAQHGTLSDTSFDIAGDETVIEQIYVNEYTDDLILAFDQALPEQGHRTLRLHLCGKSVPLAGGGLAIHSILTWSSLRLDWTAGTTVHLALSAPAANEATPPTVTSAETSTDGERITLTFSEDVTVHPIVYVVGDLFNARPGDFLRSIMNLTIDGHRDLLFSADISGATITCHVVTPAIRRPQVVKLAYNNIFARSLEGTIGGLIIDRAGNALALFDEITVGNNSTLPGGATTRTGPTLSTDALTIDEGGTATYTVRLPSQPTGPVGVTLNTIPDVISLQPQTLTFTVDDWDTPQTVTLTARSDTHSFVVWAVAVHTYSDLLPHIGRSSSFLRVVVENQDTPLVLSGGSTEPILYAENGTTDLATYSVTATTVTWAASGEDRDAFAIGSTGVLSFVSPPDFENPSDADGDNVYTVGIVAADGSATGLAFATVVVANVELPEFPSATTTRSVAENTGPGVSIGAPVTATTVGAAVTYTLGGTDAASFDIVEATGQLQAKAALDYETRSSYEVTVTATNSEGSVDIMVTIDVTNIIELQPITGPATVDYEENRAVRVAAYSASSEADRELLTWSLSGADAGSFRIDEPGGVLRFDLPVVFPNLFSPQPDYEAPTDTGNDGTYEVTVEVSDGTDTVTLKVTVTITNLDEAGAFSLFPTNPLIGTVVQARLSDPDEPVNEPVNEPVWEWAR